MNITDVQRHLERIYRKPAPRPEWPKQFCDWDKMVEHGIQTGFDNITGTWLTSGSEMRRAKEVGAVWYEDENGNRIT